MIYWISLISFHTLTQYLCKIYYISIFKRVMKKFYEKEAHKAVGVSPCVRREADSPQGREALGRCKKATLKLFCRFASTTYPADFSRAADPERSERGHALI